MTRLRLNALRRGRRGFRGYSRHDEAEGVLKAPNLATFEKRQSTAALQNLAVISRSTPQGLLPTMEGRMTFSDRDKSTPAGCANFSAGGKRSINGCAITSRLYDLR